MKLEDVKFRAWDKESKQMLYHRLGERHWYTKEGKAMLFNFNNHHETAFRERLSEPMQYAGNTDKNSNEIYEKDIMKSGQGGMHLVVFRNGCFEVEHNENCCKGWKGGCLYTVHHTDEVIGNEFENPELMGEL